MRRKKDLSLGLGLFLLLGKGDTSKSVENLYIIVIWIDLENKKLQNYK